jgi:septum formation protein
MQPRFILASSSPRRRALIASLGITFEIVRPDTDESIRDGESPYDYVRRLSQEKAQTVAGTLMVPGTVLAADTVVILAADTTGWHEDGTILAKPEDADDARRMLRSLRGQAHTVCTAFTLMHMGAPQIIISDDVRTVVHMRDYTDTEIDAYIATGDPFDKAGSYAIQHDGFQPVARIEGCFNNVVGLPLCAVKRALAAINWPGIAAPAGCDCPELNSRVTIS